MISKFFIERPVLANTLAILIVLIGLVALYNLPVAQYPNVVPGTVQVTTRYPGASAQTVIDTVALPIELQVNGVEDMLYMQSTSASDGSYTLTVTFDIGTDLDFAQVLVQNRVASALASLPQPVQVQGVTVQKKSTAILEIVALTSPTGQYDALYLTNYATINMVSELARLPGVGNVNVFGVGQYSMRVWMDPQKLYTYSLVPADVIAAVQSQSQDIAAGQVGMPPAPSGQEFQYTVTTEGRLSDPEQFADIIVRDQTAQGGRLIRVKDIGRVELGAQTYSQDFKLDGKPAGGIAIYQTPEANALNVAELVAAKMQALSKRFPQGLTYSIPFDTTGFVTTSIDEVYKTLIQAGVLVLIVILVFLQNFRATLVPATTVPVTIIGAFAAMAALGFTINIATLFGIVLAIGIVVDDAIVIVEGVSSHIEQGMPGPQAAEKAMDELFGPVIGITLVLMSVFIPAAFLPGMVGQMFAQFALVMAATALISAINAATLKPTQCALWLRPPVPPEKRNIFYRGFNKVYDAVERRYVGLITRMVRHAGIMAAIALVLSGLGLYGILRLPTAFIPNEDQGYLMIGVQLPDGASLERTAVALGQAAEIARKVPGVRNVIQISGISVLDNNATLANAGLNYVMLDDWGVRLKQKGQDLRSVVETIQAQVNALPDGRGFVLVPPPILGIGNAGGFAMQVELVGGSFDYQRLAGMADAIVKGANKNPEIQRAQTSFHAGAPQVKLNINRAQAQTMRVSVGDILSTVSSYVGSTYVNQFNKFGLALQVYAQADSQFRLGPDDILSLNVRSQDGNMVPVGAVATIERVVAPSLIGLYNLYPTASVVGAPAAGYSSGQAIAAMDAVAAGALPADGAYQWTAMSYQENLVGDQLLYVFALSILLVYLCLAGQYESWIAPLAVILAVPLALIGPAIALGLTGLANNLYTQIGLLLLIALSAKNGILIVEVARERHKRDGVPIEEAAVEASRRRLRPILMTSFAFILGVLPLVLAKGAGADARVSLGLSVFSGMIASTCLAVLFVPSFFTVLQTFEERKSRKAARALSSAG